MAYLLNVVPSYKRTVVVTNDTNQTDLHDLYAFFGSPTEAADYIFVNNANILSGGTLDPALFVTAGWASGSTLTIVNNGTIIGRGGRGGDDNNLNGRNGGHAIRLYTDVSINNTNGFILGGGGGGGAGGYSYSQVGIGPCAAFYGGDGGGGQGSNGGSGFTNGSFNSNGFGQVRGGDGGTAGQDGEDGEDGTRNCGVNSSNITGGTGGTAGRAIQTQGNNVIWLGGSTSPNVEGLVS